MTKPKPRIEIDVRGVRVGFLRRDIRQISDAERARVENLVDSVCRESDPDQSITRIVIETDYPDPDRLSYVASYRVQVVERSACDDGSGQGDGGRDAG